MQKKAYVEIRSQKSRGGSANAFGGPDTYVAVQVVPDGVERLKVLNHSIAEKRGIDIIYCGEGYSRNQQTGRSSLNQAKDRARELADAINSATEHEKAS